MDEFNADRIGFDLTAVSNFFNHRRADIQKEIYPDGVSSANGYIIAYLCEYDNKTIYQRDIEKEFDLGRSTVSTILKELEKEGLVERKSVFGDARLKKVTATPAAKAINEACRKEVERFFWELASDLKDSEMQTFEKVLSVLKKNGERIRGANGREYH